MKKWQIGGTIAALMLAVIGIVGASLAGSPAAPPPNSRVVANGPIVSANPDWRPPGAPDHQPPVPLAPALPAPTGPVLFSADFKSSDTGAWQTSILNNTDQPAVWLAHDGLLQIMGDVNGDDPLEEATFRTGDKNWQNVTIDADILAASGEGAGLIWNAGAAGYYRLQLYPDIPNPAAKASLELVQNVRATKLAETPAAAYIGYQPYVWQQVRVTSTAGRQEVWVNGVKLFDVQNAVLTSGQVGLFAWADSKTSFDNVRVQSALAQR